MPLWISSILETVLKVGIEWFQSWYAAEEAKAQEWNLKTVKGQMESIKIADQAEKKIEQAVADAPKSTTPSGWNAGVKGLLFLLMVLALNGCIVREVFVHDKRIVPVEIKRPTVPEKPDQWTEREKILADYAMRLEAAYNAVRAEAAETNQKNGY